MTHKEIIKAEIKELQEKLEKLYTTSEYILRAEQGEKIGAIASCDNCAYSCVRDENNNFVACGKRLCRDNWCPKWCAENQVSANLRKNYPYDSNKLRRLQYMFGPEFFAKCEAPDKMEIVAKMLGLIVEFDEMNSGAED